MPCPLPTPAPVTPRMKPRFFKTPDALRAWFATHGASRTELWIGYYKKASGRGGVVYRQALDEALCVGWIDGVVKSIDDACYMQRYTPRTPRSTWSHVNVQRVGELTAAGRMTPAGLAAFARRDPARTGVYTFEQPPQEFPAAMRRAFKAEAAAWRFFEAQPPGYRRTVIALVLSAKQETTRLRRLANVIAHSARGERIPQLGGTPRRAPASVKKR